MAEADLTKLGKYDVVRILGRGAMGTVYEGFDPVIARRVAIKTVSLEHADDPEAAEDLQRFKREAQAAGRLTHPNIVGVYDYGETESVAYIVMEYVEGSTLKSLLDNGERFAVADAVRLMESLLTGLAYSHEHGVIHRDIKPANVMITKDGRVKLADFGVARIESSSLTQAGTMIGTPSYMSPEQFMGQTIDARTDIYSAGVMFYQLLTGEKPFEGSITAIMHKVLNVEPPAPSVLSISVTPGLDAIVRRAMAKRPDDRFATAREFAEALGDDWAAGGRSDLADAPGGDGFDEDATMIAGAMASPPPPPKPTPATPPRAAPPTAATAPGTPARNHALLLGGIAAAAVVIAGGGTYLLLSGGQHQPPASTSTSTSETTIAATKKSAPAQTTPAAPTSTAPATPAPSPSQTASTPPPATPAQPAAPTPSASATQPAAPTQAPPSSPAAVEARLERAIGAASCAMTRGYATNGQYRIDGLVSAPDRASLAAAIDGVKNALPGVGISSDLRDFTGPYCGVISAIRGYAPPFAPAASRLGMQMAGGAVNLVEGDKITVDLTPPAWATHIEIDYVSSNGQIYRVQPATAGAAGGMLQETLGSVGAPFGRDMIVAIATSAPIPLKKGGELTTTKAWPATLEADLSRIKADGGHVATAAVLLDTTRKQ